MSLLFPAPQCHTEHLLHAVFAVFLTSAGILWEVNIIHIRAALCQQVFLATEIINEETAICPAAFCTLQRLQ